VDPSAGRIAIVSGIIGAVGVVFLILFYVLFFATPLTAFGQTFGILNDVCIAIQYLLAIPLALSLRRILQRQAPTLIRVATIVGIASMVAVVVLQMALVIGVVTFQQQVLWVSLAMIGGVGSWLVVIGVVARSTGRFPGSLRMSLVAVPYLFYPIWAFWLGKRLSSER
jgi:hypothetical protein